jgi:prevent-host-death family protein
MRVECGSDQLNQIRSCMALSVIMVSLYEAKTRLSSLVDEAAAGAEIVIAKHGKPLAKLVPFREQSRRRAGRANGRIWIAADFDAPLPGDVLDGFSAKRA